LKKPTGSVRFWFYKPETEKTEPNRKKQKKTEPNQKKPSQTRKNRAKLKKPSQVGLNRFWFFLKKNSVWLLFFNRNRTEPKMITLTHSHNNCNFFYVIQHFSLLKIEFLFYFL